MRAPELAFGVVLLLAQGTTPGKTLQKTAQLGFRYPRVAGDVGSAERALGKQVRDSEISHGKRQLAVPISMDHPLHHGTRLDAPFRGPNATSPGAESSCSPWRSAARNPYL